MSMVTIDTLIASLAKPGIHLGYRCVAEGDEKALMPQEARFFSRAAAGVRRRSGAARIVARGLLEHLDHREFAITKARSGAPLWPPGIVGSLAHDETMAVAAVARATNFSQLGIDIEPAETLPDKLAELVSTPAERLRYGRRFLERPHLFAAKEAVYKAVHPSDGIFLDYRDVEIDFESGTGRTSYGKIVRVGVVASADHVIALAYER